MKKKKSYSPEEYAVLVPYRDLSKLLEAAANMEELEHKLRRIDERNAAMQLMFTQLAEKVAEMDKYL